jgi:hypothetical protein
METTQHKNHHAPSKQLRQKAKPGLWIKGHILKPHYELTAFWTNFNFEATLQTN